MPSHPADADSWQPVQGTDLLVLWLIYSGHYTTTAIDERTMLKNAAIHASILRLADKQLVTYRRVDGWLQDALAGETIFRAPKRAALTKTGRLALWHYTFGDRCPPETFGMLVIGDPSEILASTEEQT